MEQRKQTGKTRFSQNKLIKHDLNDALGKLPPQALDLEEAVLGALLLEKDALTNINEILRPESFYKESHQIIFRGIQDLFDKSEPIDLLTVTNYLRKKGELELAGGAYYITELTTKINSAANIEHHARIVAEQAIKRDLITIATEIHRDAYEETTDVFSLLDKTEQHLFQVSENNIRKQFSSLRDLMRIAIDELAEKRLHDSHLTGVPTGFTALDSVTSGFQKSDLIIVAARPGMGKTAFVLSVLRNASVQFNKPVAIFSLEMSSVQLVNRLICAEAELDSEKIKKGDLQEHEWLQLNHKISNLTEAKIFIDDTPAISIRELRTKCRKLKTKDDIQMVIIDYLQLMSAEGNSKGNTGNREQEISAISRALKQLAKELNVPVIALSQLSRSVENRGGDKRPQLSDLRESGAIEQDADMVMFLYRPEYYKILVDENNNSLQNMAEVIIAKHRNGSLENVWLKFIGKYTKFCDLDAEGFSSETTENNFSSTMNKFSSKLNTGGLNSFDSEFGNSNSNDVAPF